MTSINRAIILLVLSLSLPGCDTFPEAEEGKVVPTPFYKQVRYECMLGAQAAWGWRPQQELYIVRMDAKGFTVKRSGLFQFFGINR